MEVFQWLWHMAREGPVTKELLRGMDSIWTWYVENSLECLRSFVFGDPRYKACPDLFDLACNVRSKVKVYYPQNHKNPATLWAEGRDCLIFCFRGFIDSEQVGPFLCGLQLRKVVEKILRIQCCITTRWNDQIENFWEKKKVRKYFSDFPHILTPSIACPWQVPKSTANTPIISNSSKEPLNSTKLFTCRNEFSLPKRWLYQGRGQDTGIRYNLPH